jgi:hypothetical protein
MIQRLLPISMAVLVTGCSTTIDPEDYERSCGQDEDCVPILVGDVCDCGCDMAAIHVDDLDQYQEDRAGISCGNDCGACPGAIAVCRGGRCEAVAE